MLLVRHRPAVRSRGCSTAVADSWAAEIEDVAITLFAVQGYDNVTTDDIARACGMSVRTFFRYFNAKRDVVLAMPRRSLALLCDAVLARPEDENLLTSWRIAAIAATGENEVDLELIVRMKAVLVENPELFEMINGDAELTDRFVQTTAQRLGLDPTTDLRPAVLAGAVRSALIAAMDQWSTGDATSLAASFAEAFDILADLEAVGAARPRPRPPIPAKGRVVKGTRPPAHNGAAGRG